jgi:polar amino acid transport system ATP-binding protein
MVGEVLKLLRKLSEEGMTMMCVTHEMGFAREVSDRIWFLKKGELKFNGEPAAFFSNDAPDEVRSFLAAVNRTR